MKNKITKAHQSLFEQIKQTDESGNEYWTARKLAKVLEYADYRNFHSVINKAKEACVNSGQPLENHVVEINDMVAIGSGAERPMPSYKLSRYACYLIVQNADSGKEVWLWGKPILPSKLACKKFVKWTNTIN